MSDLIVGGPLWSNDSQGSDLVREAKAQGYQPAGSIGGLEELRALVNTSIDILADVSRARSGPVAVGGPPSAKAAARQALSTPVAAEQTFRHLIRAYAEWSVDTSDPASVARMQCAPLPAAVACELVTATLNQSLHAWESGPFALELERYVVDQFVGLVGYSEGAGGTLTAGGSVSNLMALLLARDHATASYAGHSAFRVGLAGIGGRPVVLCSESSHFSVGRAVGITGIGEESIIRVPADPIGRMLPEEADRILSGLPTGTIPVALVACVGSTDLGWIDPLPELAAVARRHGVWLHADAAYGGGALFSTKLRGMLDGLTEADSITIDMHKYGWTPASAAIFLVRDARTLHPLAQQTTTLNAADDKEAGYIGLYGNSVQATRRSDALKIAMTLALLGPERLGAMVDACLDLATYAAKRIAAEPALQLAAEPLLSSVLFRYLPPAGGTADAADAFNGELRRRLMREGKALLARSRLRQPDGSKPVFLKLMFLNPQTTTANVDRLIDTIVATAEKAAG